MMTISEEGKSNDLEAIRAVHTDFDSLLIPRTWHNCKSSFALIGIWQDWAKEMWTAAALRVSD